MKKAKEKPEVLVIMLWLSSIRNLIPMVDPYQQSKHDGEVNRISFYLGQAAACYFCQMMIGLVSCSQKFKVGIHFVTSILIFVVVPALSKDVEISNAKIVLRAPITYYQIVVPNIFLLVLSLSMSYLKN